MKKVTIVYNKKTKKLVPFRYGDKGEIIIMMPIKVEAYVNDCIVSMVDPQRLDLKDGYLLDEGEVYVEKEDYEDIYGID